MMTCTATSARRATPVATASVSPESNTFIANSPAYRDALIHLERFAKHDVATVLIEGETGTGKTFFARHLHRSSPRAGAVFRTVLMSALDDSLAGSDLFGHVPGAFTDARSARHGHFASANGGTIFLDEINKTSRAIQGKLLSVLENGEFQALGADRNVRVNIRLVAATNVCLEEQVAQGHFLPDLLARFGYFRVRIPPLRERREDIPALVAQIVATRARDFGYAAAPRLDQAFVRTLQAHTWPGNVRQLDAILQRILVDAERASTLTLDHCCGVASYLELSTHVSDGGSPIERTAELFAATQNVSEVARRLGVNRATVQRRLAKRAQDVSSVVPHAAGSAAASDAACGSSELRC
jgi:two-component system, NtrC family, response regulator